MRPLERLRLLALACAALTAAPAWAAPAASRFEGARWIAPPADSAGFGAARRALAELERASDPASGPRVAVPVRLARARAADSVAARFGARLASRAGADSVAIAQLQLLRHQLRLPVFGMSDSVTRTLLGEGAALLERRIGADHAGLAPALALVSAGYERMQDPRRWLAAAERRVTLLERSPGLDSLELAAALGARCRARAASGDAAGAIQDGERGVAIAERRAGAHDLRTADALTDLASVFVRQNRFADALAIQERVLAIRERALGPDHRRVALALQNVAGLEMRLDRLAAARAHAARAVAIWERPEHDLDPEGSSGQAALGDIARRSGDYEAARRAMETALQMRRRALAPADLRIAASLENLAGLHEEMGDYAAALPRRQESLAIRSRGQGETHADYATALDALARLLVAMGRAPEGRPMSERAVAVREAARGAMDPGLVRMLNTLGDAQRAMDDAPGALATYRRAERILAAGRGAATVERATVLRRLGQAQIALHQPASAESSYSEGLAVARRALGESHPLAIDLLDDLAHAQRDLGHGREALASALEAERRGRERFRLQVPALSEREALRYGEVRPSGLPIALGLIADGADPTRVGEVWEALAHNRGQVLDEITERRRALRRAETPELDSLRGRFADASRELGGLLARGTRGDSAWEARVAESRARIERIEAALGSRSRSFRDERSRESMRFADLAAALPPGAALVSFTRYALVRWRDGRQTLDDRIAAFVLRQGGAPEVITVGSTDLVDSLCLAWRSEMRPIAATDDAAARERDAERIGLALRRLVWDPIAARIGEARRVFVVPEGELHLIDLAALPTDRGRYLVESGREFHMLAGERDLLWSPASPGRGLLALGDVSFDSSGVDPAASGALAAAVPAWRGAPAACAAFRDASFARLPGTAAEAAQVAALWPGEASEVVRLAGPAASEAAVKRLAPGRRIVHLATHGFYVDPRCAMGQGGGRGIGGLAPSDSTARAAAPAREPDPFENPLRLSGLALAGANRRAGSGADGEDGILTAEELAALDLSGVEWVVLSACETGVGAVHTGEGVTGLRRALHTAGAHTLISSLWAVEDESATRWMTALYRRRLRERQDTVAAVNGADRDELARRRRAGMSTHPFHWAGFVAAGDWR